MLGGVTLVSGMLRLLLWLRRHRHARNRHVRAGLANATKALIEQERKARCLDNQAQQQPGYEDKDVDEEFPPIPAHLRAQARRDGEGSSAPSSTTDYYSPARWVFVRNRDRGLICPRSLRASMLRTADRRYGTTDSLKAINYGPVELRLRKLLALFNWRRWWH